MAGPYRDSGGDEPAEAPRDAGIVGDVIAQFADAHAYLRELVQNSIDAGSPSVDVEVSYERADQRLRVAVRDRGEGMTRDIIENQLLVLFRSTKEDDRTKIGKFGIGFASVLSPNPEVVTVHSSRDGRRLTLHLYRDLSYELFDAGPATQTGTTVELEIAMPPGDVSAYRTACETALRRWCRHAMVPINFVDVRPEQKTASRIDKPLELDHVLVQVTRSTDDDQLTVVVGISGTGGHVGFFNHGLMLHESPGDLVGNGIDAKIQDSRLGHTLSRDDVRRDRHFDRAVEFAREVAQGALADAIGEKLRELAEAGDHANHFALALATSSSSVRPPHWWVPLVEPYAGKRTILVGALGRTAWAAPRSTALTKRMAADGRPVVLAPDPELGNVLARVAGCELAFVHREITAITPEPRTDADDALLAFLLEILDEVHRKPRSILLARLDGLHADALAICAADENERIVEDDNARRNPFGLFLRRTLVLSVEASAVKGARAAADPRVAASHLARAILLQYRLLDIGRSERILDIALERAGVAR
ncbi:MAG: hypothetical protein HOV81_33140 [Kofleriaceae bacterium]|nr:hypothetical protein [Kofleriaceae bacterium]